MDLVIVSITAQTPQPCSFHFGAGSRTTQNQKSDGCRSSCSGAVVDLVWNNGPTNCTAAQHTSRNLREVSWNSGLAKVHDARCKAESKHGLGIGNVPRSAALHINFSLSRTRAAMGCCETSRGGRARYNGSMQHREPAPPVSPPLAHCCSCQHRKNTVSFKYYSFPVSMWTCHVSYCFTMLLFSATLALPRWTPPNPLSQTAIATYPCSTSPKSPTTYRRRLLLLRSLLCLHVPPPLCSSPYLSCCRPSVGLPPPLPCPPHSTTADVSPPVRLSSFAPSFLVLHPHLDSVHRQASSVLASSCPILWSGSLPTTLHRRRRQPTGPCLLLCPLLPPSSICISIRSIASLRRRSVLFALLLGGLVVLLTVPCGAISNLASILLPLDAVLIAPGSLFRRQHKISHLSVLKNCLC